MANKLLAKVNPIFFGVSSITGAANFQCDQLAVPINGGKPEDANIAGTISLTQVKMQSTGLMGAILTATGSSEGQLITLHPTPFTVRNGFVKYPDMQMDIGTMPINFSGSVPIGLANLRDPAEGCRGPSRFIYVHALDYDRGGEWAGKNFMCTADRSFAIRVYKTVPSTAVSAPDSSRWTPASCRSGPSASPIRSRITGRPRNET